MARDFSLSGISVQRGSRRTRQGSDSALRQDYSSHGGEIRAASPYKFNYHREREVAAHRYARE